ncbi:hypothetical protein MKX03_008459 [Papaver bracteatum]|nr:hypothetical protein MKX03_008459 [Papaver bracteatum]
MVGTIIAALSACSPANHSLRTTLMTKISGGSDSVIPLGMKSNTKPSFRGLRVTAKTQAPEKINDCVYRGNFTIRSLDHFIRMQETAANHIRDIGLVGDGFNSTPEMIHRNMNTTNKYFLNIMLFIAVRLSFFFCGMFKLIDGISGGRGDVVEIDTWFGGAPIKNGFAIHWLLRDANTGETLAQANGVWIMMNKNTRKLSRIPEEVRDEITPHIKDYGIWDDIKLSKLHDNEADSVQTGVIAYWSDLDVNHHVNFSKYIGWILENSPIRILKSQELCDLSLEFRKECGVGDELKSLTRVFETDGHTECQHMLQFENGMEVMRGRTKWRPAKHTNAVNLQIVEIRSSADMFWETLKTWSAIFPKVLPETYKSIAVIEEMNGEKNGSVTLWKINPNKFKFIAYPIEDGAPVMMEEMKRLENLDELTKTTYSVIGGDLLKLYKSYEPQLKVAPSDHKVFDEEDEKVEKRGGTVKWSVKYEKVNEMVPEPYMIKEMIYKTLVKLDEYILAKQKEVTSDN